MSQPAFAALTSEIAALRGRHRVGRVAAAGEKEEPPPRTAGVCAGEQRRRDRTVRLEDREAERAGAQRPARAKDEAVRLLRAG